MLPNMSDGRQRASKTIALIGPLDRDNCADLQICHFGVKGGEKLYQQGGAKLYH